MSAILDDIKPADLGFDPQKFPQYRRIQLEAVELVTQNERRFTALSIPPGGGKTLVAATIHRLTGWRTLALTITKGLMGQYKDTIDVADIRGKQNYECHELKMNCGDGARAGCSLAAVKSYVHLHAKCTYEMKRCQARNNEFIISNYAYWLHMRDGLERNQVEADELGENPIECLILDEADGVPEILSGFLSCNLYEKELVSLLEWDNAAELGENLALWVQSAALWSREAGMQLANIVRVIKAKGGRATKAELEHAGRLESLVERLDKIRKIDITDQDWIVEEHQGRYGKYWEFGTVNPGRQAESKLFSGIPHVVVMSGSLRPEDLAELWIKKDDYKFQEWPRIFPPNRNPIYLIPARKLVDGEWKDIRIDKDTTDEDKSIWLDLQDEFLSARTDRKGIILVTSYQYQKFIMENSRHRRFMIGNTDDDDSESASEAFERFVKAVAPAILVSPSFARGWDMRYEIAEFGIIPKIPFKPMQSKIMQARLDRNKRYGDYVAMKEIRQMIGRGGREMDDRFEVLICDGHGKWFLYRNKNLAARGFVDEIRKRVELPKPPPKLERKIISNKVLTSS